MTEGTHMGTKYETPETFDDLYGLIQAMKGLQRGNALIFEIDNLYSMQEWALEQQPVQAGDRAVLDTVINFDKAPGWKPYEEALSFGAIGTVTKVGYNGYHKYWAAGFKPDELWSTSDSQWSDQEPKRYDHPESKTFTLSVDQLKKI